MKTLEISKLMDEYQDDEFFPEEGSAADTQAVKNRVLTRIGPVKQKGRITRKKKVLLAAALAAVMMLLVGAGIPAIARCFYTITPEGQSISRIDGGPVCMENGRLWFIADDQHIDITDVIDEETPFIYDCRDPETGLGSCLIVGGTPDYYGWYEYIDDPDISHYGGGTNAIETYYIIDGVRYREDALTEEQWQQINTNSVEWDRIVEDRPWLVAGKTELGIRWLIFTSS